MDVVRHRARRLPDRRLWDGPIPAERPGGLEGQRHNTHTMDVDKSFDELTVVYRLADLGAQRVARDRMIMQVLQLVKDLLPCRRALLFLFDASSDQMRVYGAGGEEERLPLSHPSVIRRIFNSGPGEVIDDPTADPDADSGALPLLGARNLAAAPLEAGRDRIGVVAALDSTRGSFVEADLRLLRVLAQWAALTLQNTHLRAKVQRQEQELTGLSHLSRLLGGAESLEFVIGESVRIARDLLNCFATVIFLCDEASNALVAQPPAAGTGDDRIEGVEISLAEPSLAATVYRTNRALMSNEARDDAWVGDALRRAFGIESLLVVPLCPGPQPIGVLVAMNARRGHFDEDDLSFTTVLGGRIASVIEGGRARERERALLQRLRETDRNKTEFVSMLAHELKGPMTTVKGFGDALRDRWDEIDEAKRTKFLDILTTEVDRLSHLVSDLLDSSRMEAGSLRYEPRPTPVHNVIDRILEAHPSLSDRHRIERRVPADLPDALGDGDRVSQILLNLLSNAVCYSPEGTTVTLTADCVDENGTSFVRVGVSDQGIGIAQSDRERVFSKFVMLPKPAWVEKGHGLGLFITKGMVEAQGGRIWVESEPGRGSTFYFTMPVADQKSR
jgi:signal transduction histidine kinase